VAKEEYWPMSEPTERERWEAAALLMAASDRYAAGEGDTFDCMAKAECSALELDTGSLAQRAYVARLFRDHDSLAFTRLSTEDRGELEGEAWQEAGEVVSLVAQLQAEFATYDKTAHLAGELLSHDPGNVTLRLLAETLGRAATERARLLRERLVP
jgi:hypothetical protein